MFIFDVLDTDDNDDKFAREFRNFSDSNCVNSTRKLYLNK